MPIYSRERKRRKAGRGGGRLEGKAGGKERRRRKGRGGEVTDIVESKSYAHYVPCSC